MFDKGIIMCAWCKAIKTPHGFIEVPFEHLGLLDGMSILYETCEQCRVRLLAGNTVIYEPHVVDVPEERRCNYD